ncbi:MAG: hypothetical protein ABI960_01580 [Candidatus Eisenbacteria bacterium]
MNPDRTPEDDALDPSLRALWRAADAVTRAPAGFDERLFVRLEREAPARVVAAAADPALVAWAWPALPWWVRAAGECHVVLALAVAGALVAWPTAWSLGASYLGAGGLALARALDQGLAAAAGLLLGPLAAPRIQLALALCVSPALGWVSLRAARAAESWARRGGVARAAFVRAR